MNPEYINQIYSHLMNAFVPRIDGLRYLLRYNGQNELQNHLNPLVREGKKVFSQNDEDGITFEILRRIGLTEGVFAEFGVGNGLENNTLALAAAGWCGFWVGNEDIIVEYNPHNLKSLNFDYVKSWINLENIVSLYNTGLGSINQKKCNLISLDLDGNDYYFVEQLLKNGVNPEVFIVEYNAKFIPPIKFVIDYDPLHEWGSDDYFGASLSSYAALFEKYGYFLACCNITGIDAFFIRNEFRPLFSDIPQDIEKLYASPKYFLLSLDYSGHGTSKRTVDKIFAQLNKP